MNERSQDIDTDTDTDADIDTQTDTDTVADTGVVWVIGGGSGIGRATAVRLARAGRTVVVSGRRADALAATVAEIESVGGKALALPVDVTDAEATKAARDEISERLGSVGTLIFAAGTNVRERWWDTLDTDSFRSVLDVNLTSAVTAVSAVLPGMRAAGGGRIFIVGSWAGWRYMSVAGAAYAASKFGLASVVESLNDQEGRAGIRATLVIPGEVETEIMKTRPVQLSAEELAAMLRPDDIAMMIENIVRLPARVTVNEVVVSGVLNGIYLRDSAYQGAVRVSADSSEVSA